MHIVTLASPSLTESLSLARAVGTQDSTLASGLKRKPAQIGKSTQPVTLSRRVLPIAGVKLRVSRRNGVCRQAQNRVECRHRVKSPVEPEDVLIDVCRQVLVRNAVVRAKQPRLEVRENKVTQRKMHVVRLRCVHNDGVVDVVKLVHAVVSLPTIRPNDRAFDDVAGDEAIQSFAQSIGDNSHAKAPGVYVPLEWLPVLVCNSPNGCPIFTGLTRSNFNSTDHECFMVDTAPFSASLSTYQSLVDLDRVLSTNHISVRSDHASTELVQDLVGCLVAPDAQLPLKLQSGLTRRLCRYEIRAPKPRREWRVRRLHDSARCQRDVGVAGPTPKDSRTPFRETIRLTDRPALGAREAIGPPEFLEVIRTRGIVGENALKFGQRGRETACIHTPQYSTNSEFGKEPDRHGVKFWQALLSANEAYRTEVIRAKLSQAESDLRTIDEVSASLKDAGAPQAE